MDSITRDAVRSRANNACEYCKLEQWHSGLTHHIEHVTARQHVGTDDLANLALACHRCNLFKGPNLAGIDSKTGRLVRLFHPRRMKWSFHFRWLGSFLVGRTAIGRATIAVLNINEGDRVELRQALLEESIQWVDDD